jgi:hypothetical protein
MIQINAAGFAQRQIVGNAPCTIRAKRPTFASPSLPRQLTSRNFAGVKDDELLPSVGYLDDDDDRGDRSGDPQLKAPCYVQSCRNG